jgi:hypothetical protein
LLMYCCDALSPISLKCNKSWVCASVATWQLKGLNSPRFWRKLHRLCSIKELFLEVDAYLQRLQFQELLFLTFVEDFWFLVKMSKYWQVNLVATGTKNITWLYLNS